MSRGTSKTVHFSAQPLMLGTDAHTRCGLVGSAAASSAPYFHLLTENGGTFRCVTNVNLVSCQKCRNLLDIGTIHARRET